MINEDRSRLKDFDGSEASLVNEDDLSTTERGAGGFGSTGIQNNQLNRNI